MTNISASYILTVRQALRINHTSFDGEIKDLIEAAKADLLLSGIILSRVNDESDALIKRAIVNYVKSEFGLDNADSVKYRESYDMLKRHLMLSTDYITAEV